MLVQCGYDFKEALRRKRLNALPLNDCMSLWSEEECHKFEEGIQKYGKDFLKIRQNQVSLHVTYFEYKYNIKLFLFSGTYAYYARIGTILLLVEEKRKKRS